MQMMMCIYVELRLEVNPDPTICRCTVTWQLMTLRVVCPCMYITQSAAANKSVAIVCAQSLSWLQAQLLQGYAVQADTNAISEFALHTPENCMLGLDSEVAALQAAAAMYTCIAVCWFLQTLMSVKVSLMLACRKLWGEEFPVYLCPLDVHEACLQNLLVKRNHRMPKAVTERWSDHGHAEAS